jgi:hypothetical protein
MPTIREFNADAFTHLARHVATAALLRRGTSDRMVATEEAVTQSQALLTRVDAVLATGAGRRLPADVRHAVTGATARIKGKNPTDHYPPLFGRSGKHGTCYRINPQTGERTAMTRRPYDPEKQTALEKEWSQMRKFAAREARQKAKERSDG